MYREKINGSIGNVYQAGVAAKILQYMNKIRNESDITQARRWVMELLQNARDLAWTDKSLQVQIELGKEALIFRHSGKPFRVKDILAIVNQVSSKNPGEGVGQFGTGFMTTYQLSERVEIRSLLKEEGWPGKEFQITLDRTGRTKEEILQAISCNLEELQKVDEYPDAAVCEPGTGYDTEFRYMLENDLSRRIAKTGLTDLADTVFYVMLFSRGIGRVELTFADGEERETVIYRRGECRQKIGHIEELTLIEERGQEIPKKHTFMFMQEQGMTLASEYDSERGFLPVSERTPRIFVDFPLIGAERFPFPVVINHLKLEPNEPRSGISLVDNPDSQMAQNNKELLEMAVRNYEIFMRDLLQIDTRGIANLIGTFAWQENKEWSESWVKKNLYEAIYKIIEKLPIFPTDRGMLSLDDESLHIIQSEEAEEKEGIRKLLVPLRDHIVPLDETDWYQVLEPYQISDEKFIHLEKLLKGATKYMDTSLEVKKQPAMEWNHLLYRTAMKNPVLATEIQAGNLAVFPSQNPEDQKAHRLFTIHQIYQDPEIPEILKDVAEALQVLDHPTGGDDRYLIRRMLLPREFVLAPESSMPQYELTTLTEYIRERSNRGYGVRNFAYYRDLYENAWRKAWNLLLSCGPDEEMYVLCNAWYKGVLPKRKKLEDERFSEYLWRNTYCCILNKILENIENFFRLEEFEKAYFKSCTKEAFYQWMNRFYKACAHYLREGELHHRRIFPDQEGRMRWLNDLAKDGGKEEELKEIALCFQDKDPSCNLYRELLDCALNLEGWTVAVKGDRDVAMRINNVVQKLLMECSLSQAELVHQEACTRLLGWIQEHPRLAQEYFPAFYNEEDQMKLLTPRAAASMHRKAKGYAKLMEVLGTEDPEELEKLMLQARQMGSMEDKTWSGEGFFDDDADMWLDGELLELEEDERKRVCDEIGLAGERYIFEQVRQRLMEQGYQVLEEDQNQVKLSGSDGEYTILWPDTADYHQAGWDITVIRRSPNKESGLQPIEICWYLEVKTHTLKSVKRGQLFISNEQMKMAADRGDRYILLSVAYDYHQKKVDEVKVYENLCRQLAKGKLVNIAGRYCFEER